LEDVVILDSGYINVVHIGHKQVIARKGGVLRDEAHDFDSDANRNNGAEQRFTGVSQA
jgi:hypothetical protein